MSDWSTTLQDLERRVDAALGTLEQDNQWAEALAHYHAAGAEVDALPIPKTDPAYRPSRKLRAYLYLREANALRALGRPTEAEPLADLELDAAMASGDRLTIARAMFSLGASCVANGQMARGLKLLEDARPMFEHGPDADHQQGLGWWHIIQADLSNSGLHQPDPAYALENAHHALALLRPLENWPGIARAYQARAKAYAKQGNVTGERMAEAAAAAAQAKLKKPPG